jgi:hypothetical protein
MTGRKETEHMHGLIMVIQSTARFMCLVVTYYNIY